MNYVDIKELDLIPRSEESSNRKNKCITPTLPINVCCVNFYLKRVDGKKKHLLPHNKTRLSSLDIQKKKGCIRRTEPEFHIGWFKIALN